MVDGFPMPSSTVENYVKEIFLLQSGDRSQPVPMGRVASALDVSAGTATTMMKSLERAGLLVYTPRRGVRLTPEGEGLALGMIRRHRLVELFLVKVLKLDWTEIHDEAERLEHALSDRVLDALDEFLGHPEADPHGDPIPRARGPFEERALESLRSCGVGETVRVARITDQNAEFLQFVEANALKPGTRLKVTRRDRVADSTTIEGAKGGRTLTLGSSAAGKILVE